MIENPGTSRYQQGAKSENLQYDFLIGEWDVTASYYQQGKLINQQHAFWSAQYRDEKRMVLDEWTGFSSDNQKIVHFITLRTYSDTYNKWQIVGLQAFQPILPAVFTGQWKNGEMHLSADVHTPQGIVKTKARFFNIDDESFAHETLMSADGENWDLVHKQTAKRCY